ncbi:hypothetical protein GJV85_12700 [Sulfurimonas aquatica]|uniref:Uncharacterized protein n=1 Tax=Sulfurimonas aquatica TaxID=2672570 RepID=A0A975B2E1_9BACT|nr:hypothetical protein [Sulfurimonas aquatica]QSZ42929.1 hypothetical protein GJV85_12700 [Sulfurimonas aquatica]
MKEIKSDSNYLDINQIDIVEVVNNKCLNNLGHIVIDKIVTTPHNKTKVEFSNGNTLNFSSYRSAFEYLNAIYNLKIKVHATAAKKVALEVEDVDSSNIDIIATKLKKMITGFKGSNHSVKLNKMDLANYLESYEWTMNKFSIDDIRYIINMIDEQTEFEYRLYTRYIEGYFSGV